MSESSPREITRKQRGFFQRCLCCCFGGDNDDGDDDADDAPARRPRADFDPTEEEIAALREKMRLADERLRQEARERALARVPTAAENAIRALDGLGAVDVRIFEEDQAAWNTVFDGDVDMTPEHVIDVLSRNPNLNVAGNLQVRVTRTGRGVILTINCKQPGDDGEDLMSWDRMRCQMSLSRTITRDEDGAITVVDERTDLRGGGCKQLYQALLPLYQEMGVQSVSLSADDVGSYAWVRYGFRPSPQGWAELRDKIEVSLEKLIADDVLDGPIIAQVRELLAQDDPDTIEQIANLNQVVEGSDRSLGFRLLHKNIWKGELDLTDEAAVARVQQYISR